MHTDIFNEFPESLFFLLGKPKTHVVCGLIFCETFKRDNIKNSADEYEQQKSQIKTLKIKYIPKN